jgi:hypothetical protein
MLHHCVALGTSRYLPSWGMLEREGVHDVIGRDVTYKCRRLSPLGANTIRPLRDTSEIEHPSTTDQLRLCAFAYAFLFKYEPPA